MEFLSKNAIKLDKSANELDKFVIDFIKILRKYADYVIISGYVAIILGRSRATEDVDILIKKPAKTQFLKFCKELSEQGYWSLTSDLPETLWEYLCSNTGIRFAKNKTVIPNMEIKLVKNNLDNEAMNNKVKLLMCGDELQISSIELQIAYKKIILASPKDLEDARHIEKALKDFVDIEKLKKYEKLVKSEWGK